jgi:hypothetical protein
MRSTETELAIIHEKLKEIDKLEVEIGSMKTTYKTDRVEIESLLKLINSLKTLLSFLATAIIGSIFTALFSRYK